jgi:tetratricopeptide (TPR) repeat protein
MNVNVTGQIPKPPVIKGKGGWGQSIWLTIIGYLILACLIALLLWITSLFSRPIYIYLLVISLTGGFGGLCFSLIEHNGLILTHLRPIEEDLSTGTDNKSEKTTENADVNKDNKVTVDQVKQNKQIEINPGLDLGSVGDTLIGIGSAFAVFFVLSGLVVIKNNLQQIELSSIFVLAGMGIVAGAAGKAIFPMLVIKMKDLIETNKKAANAEKSAVTAQQSAATAQQNVEIAGKKADDAHAESLKLLDEAFCSTGAAFINTDKDAAEVVYNKALGINPRSFRAKIGLAMVRKRQNKLQEAIDLCTEAININPDYPFAYFNRACYKSLLEKPVINDFIDDLKIAIELDVTFRERAASDPDFNAVKDIKEFKEIIKSA